MSTVPVFVGIDISKDRLDIAPRPIGEREAVQNAQPGIAALVARLQAVQPTLIALEATGEASSFPLRRPWPRRDSLWSSSIRAKSATSPRPRGSLPRRMPSMSRSWRRSQRRYGRPPGLLWTIRF